MTFGENKIVTGVITVVLLLSVIVFSANFCVVGSGFCNHDPYLIKAKVIEYSPAKTVISDLRPITIFDQTDIIAALRNDAYGLDTDPERFFSNPNATATPSRSTIIPLSSDDFDETVVGQDVWITYDGKTVKRIFY